MTARPRQLLALLAFAVALAGSLATTLTYAALDGEWSDSVTLDPAAPAVMRRLTIVVSAEALPATEGLLSGGTYGSVVAEFPEIDGLEVAVITSPTTAPTFVQAAGGHVVLDAASCEFERECRRVVDVVLRLPGASAATEVTWTIRSGIYVPGSALPAGAELSVAGLDAVATPVAIHELSVQADGRAELVPGRPLAVTVSYTPARGTQLRLHALTLTVIYDGSRPAPSADAPRLTVEVARAGGGEPAEPIPIEPGESTTRDLQPLATCLASCQVTYRLTFTPSGAAADPAGTASWRVSGWLFAVTDGASQAPTLSVAGSQP